MRPIPSLLLLAIIWVFTGASTCDDGGGRLFISPFCAADPDATCSRFADCDDGIFCNGRERCMPGESGTDGCGCAPAEERACPDENQACDEDIDACFIVCPTANDADGDGHDSASCGGDDCDDSDRNRYPGNAEVCDDMGHDEDCDPSTPGHRDADGDGFSDARCANSSGGEVTSQGSDCDDEDRTVHPIQSEICNEVDDDCDGMADESVTATLYADGDRDGFGAGEATERCPAVGWSLYDNDCDDQNPALHPGALRCTGQQDAQAIEICQNDGTWTGASCPGSQICLAQPNGSATCELL